MHLPETGLPVDRVRDLVGPALLVGRSVHDPDAVRTSCHDGADYVFLGPVFDTPSHPGSPALGPPALDTVRELPVIAIGGIGAASVPEVRARGVRGIAAISAIWDAPDPRAAAERRQRSERPEIARRGRTAS